MTDNFCSYHLRRDLANDAQFQYHPLPNRPLDEQTTPCPGPHVMAWGIDTFFKANFYISKLNVQTTGRYGVTVEQLVVSVQEARAGLR